MTAQHAGWFARHPTLARAVLLSAVLSIVAVSLYVRPGRDRSGVSAPQSLAPSAARPIIERTTVVTEGGIPSSVAAACVDQPLKLTAQAASQVACFGKTHISQNGSVRTYQVDTTAGMRRSLRVDASGSLILKVALTYGAATLHCEGADCQGISLSKRDAEGVRILSFTHTGLTHTELGPEAQRLVLDGQLRINAEALVPALACSDQGVSIITSDGSSSTFCPKGGAGFELGNDGQKTYRFTSLDNESVLVVVDTRHRLRRVEYQSDAVLACEGASCDRVQIAAPNAAGERLFTFGGTTLLESRSGAVNAVLNGTLVAPPL